MRKLAVFDQVSLDGYFATPNGDASWLHRGQPDAEWQAFVEDNSGGGGALLFGRKTYEMMVSYWPTPVAAQQNPVVAERMNGMPKFVFSRTLNEVKWSNTKLLKGDLATEVRALKDQPGEDLVILGSGSIVAQLAEQGLIDAYQFVVFPLVLGEGRTLFEGVTQKLPLELTASRAFRNGNVVLDYRAGGK